MNNIIVEDYICLGITFANVTGFSFLSGLSGAMEPICGQAHGAKNVKLLHKTLLMVTLLLFLVSIPIDKILIRFSQQEHNAIVAKNYLF
ncbi:MATE efflux family protein DTX1 [Morus notabilis]|uniref:MATE efflux family protein DTX1 n=1 Tax=Morus notabilis TaxID=981085 RepID=W9RYL7_9ROSA|nr:MATE efflux family protein DTX1 [Morus notabilis]